MNARTVSLPLSEEELEQLEDLLVSDDVPADCMNMEMLDGYLAAVLASPFPVPVSSWLPGVWTADAEEISFASSAVQQKAIELVLRYHNDMLDDLANADDVPDDDAPQAEGDDEEEVEGWQPFCYAQGGEDDPAIGEEWVSGFEQGFELWPSDWTSRVPDAAIAEAMLETVFSEEGDEAAPATEEAQLEALEEKGNTVQQLFQIWRAQGLAAPEAVVVGAPQASLGGPGRNEPCPCGSGKKFKKCCGAN